MAAAEPMPPKNSTKGSSTGQLEVESESIRRLCWRCLLPLAQPARRWPLLTAGTGGGLRRHVGECGEHHDRDGNRATEIGNERTSLQCRFRRGLETNQLK